MLLYSQANYSKCRNLLSLSRGWFVGLLNDAYGQVRVYPYACTQMYMCICMDICVYRRVLINNPADYMHTAWFLVRARFSAFWLFSFTSPHFVHLRIQIDSTGLEILCAEYRHRLQFGVCSDILPLMEIPHMHPSTARALYTAGTCMDTQYVFRFFSLAITLSAIVQCTQGCRG